MYTLKILTPESSGRHIKLSIETYNDLSAALRVAKIRAGSKGVLALVLAGTRIVARFGLGHEEVAV